MRSGADGAARLSAARPPAAGVGKELRPHLSIIVPTKNELANVEALVARLEEVVPGRHVEILFIDDSDDGTADEIKRVGGRSQRSVRVIHRPPNRRGGGLAGAVVEGFRAARAGWVCVMDGDLQHPPELIDEMLERAGVGDVDLVLASRYCGRGSSSGFGAARAVVSRSSSAAARLLFPRRLGSVTDPMSGFFLVRRDAVDLERLHPRGFKILLEILVRTPKLRVAEVPFEFGARWAGESKTSLRQGMDYLGQLVDLRFGETLSHFVRFGLVGGSGVVVNMLAFAAFVELAGLRYLIAAVLATQISTLWNFVLTDRWVFSARESRRAEPVRLAMFFGMNNLALLLRVPMLVVLVSGLGLNELLSNFLTLFTLTVIRFGISDAWIWGGSEPKRVLYFYRIHEIITVESPVRLRELERFRVEELRGRPTIRVRLGKLSRTQSELVTALAFLTRHIRYDEGLGRFGFGVEIAFGKSIEILASPLLRFSPHVLYTNVVEPVLRWSFVRHGYALAHGACITFGEDAYLITARTDTGKTTTILQLLHNYSCAFLSDDLILIAPDGRVLSYPKPLTISSHTVQAVKAPLHWRERLPLLLQSRVHSRSGRRFALLLARTHLPVATINAIVQLLIPPPKFHVDRLVPGVEIAREARLAGFIVIERGGVGELRLDGDEAVETLICNTDDAYAFPPYPYIEHFLHSANGRDLRAEERSIITRALENVPGTLLRSETMGWYERIPALVNEIRLREPAPLPEASLDAVVPAALVFMRDRH